MGNKFYYTKTGTLVDWQLARSIEFDFWDVVLQGLDLPYRFIVTENTESLPICGEDVVVILKSDEFYSPVIYLDRVKAVFRNYYDKKYHDSKNCYFLPLPFLGLKLDVRQPPINQRKIDIFFAGQVKHSSRRQFIDAVNELRFSNKYLHTEVIQNDNFFSGLNLPDYYAKLGNSKIALCPYGASIETYRHFEALQSGCICITQPVPDAWYFQNAPYVTLNNWNELSTKVNEIFSKPGDLADASLQGISFWKRTLSPQSVIRYIHSKLSL